MWTASEFYWAATAAALAFSSRQLHTRPPVRVVRGGPLEHLIGGGTGFAAGARAANSCATRLGILPPDVTPARLP